MPKRRHEPILGEVPHHLSQRRMVKWHSYSPAGKRELWLMERTAKPYPYGLIDSWTPAEALALLEWLKGQEAALLSAKADE